MNQRKNNFITFAFLGFSTALLGGCLTSRTASFPNQNYNTVFKSAVAGLCTDKRLLVYDADKTKGVIMVQGRGVFMNPKDTAVVVTGGSAPAGNTSAKYGKNAGMQNSNAAGGTPAVSITMPGMNNPWPDRMIGLISDNLPTAKTAPAAASVSSSSDEKQDLDFEKQKLELEKEKLKFEREKLEFEKQKQKSK
ncbi:MAG TPA: hypothetical protein DCL44_01955 [Elusimicrobia bacterium]|nr:hypothetical protein [Elusimicrobiota bacterium]